MRQDRFSILTYIGRQNAIRTMSLSHVVTGVRLYVALFKYRAQGHHFLISRMSIRPRHCKFPVPIHINIYMYLRLLKHPRRVIDVVTFAKLISKIFI